MTLDTKKVSSLDLAFSCINVNLDFIRMLLADILFNYYHLAGLSQKMNADIRT